MRFKSTMKRLIPKFILNKIMPIRMQIRNFKILAIEYGQYRTIRNWVCIDKNGNPIPWITYPAIEYLNNLDLKSSTVFEYGSGFSTLYWSKRSKKIISVENDEKWFSLIAEKIKQLSNVSYHLAKREEEYIQKIDEYNEPFDIYVIDGRHRGKCARKVVEYVRKYGGGMIIFDNSDWYPKTIEFLRNELDWIEVDFCGFGPINDYCWITTMFLNRNIKINYKRELDIIGRIIQIGEDDE